MRYSAPLFALPLIAATLALPAFGAEPEAPETDARVHDGPRVKIALEQPGTEPRKALRYAPEVGKLQSIVLSISSSIGNTMGAMAMPEMKMPTTVSTITERVDEVKDGRILATVRIDEAKLGDDEGVEPMIVKQLESTISDTVGKTAKVIMTDHGVGESISFDASAKADPTTAMSINALESALNMLLTPFPDEPVGVGAVWSAESTLVQQEIQMTQKVTYTLKSMEGGTITVDIKVESHAQPQDMMMPGAPPGTEVKLTSFELTGSGTSSVTLDQVAPVEADLSFSAVSEIDITQSRPNQPAANTTQHFKQSVKSQAKVTPKAK